MMTEQDVGRDGVAVAGVVVDASARMPRPRLLVRRPKLKRLSVKASQDEPPKKNRSANRLLRPEPPSVERILLPGESIARYQNRGAESPAEPTESASEERPERELRRDRGDRDAAAAVAAGLVGAVAGVVTGLKVGIVRKVGGHEEPASLPRIISRLCCPESRFRSIGISQRR